MLDRIARWQERAPWFSFVPVLSRAGSDWNGRTGFVQRAALTDHPDMSGIDVYACGNPLMVSAALRELGEEAGLEAGNFYADAFVATSQGTGAQPCRKAFPRASDGNPCGAPAEIRSRDDAGVPSQPTRVDSSALSG